MMKKLYLLLIFCGIALQAQFSKVMDLSTGLNPGFYDQISEYNIWNEKLYYVTRNADGSNNVNVSDGTAAGTYTITTLQVPSGYSSMVIYSFKKAGNGIYMKFHVQDTSTGLGYHDLWFTDGTATNTVLVAAKARINIGGSLLSGVDNYSRPHQDSHIGNTFYFWKSEVGGNSTATLYLWQSDGTVAGTQKVAGAANVHIPYEYDYLDEVLDLGLVYNGSYYFMAQDISSTRAKSNVYKLNNAGTEEIGSYINANRMGTVFKGKMYFIATYNNPNPSYNEDREIFVSDGTSAGTELFYNFNNKVHGVEQNDHFSFHKTNDYMFIATNNTAANPRQVLATDGSTNFKTLYQGSAMPINTYFYYDDKLAYFTKKSTQVDNPLSFAINLSDFSRTDITKSFYSNYGGQVYKGSLWLANKPIYNTAIVRPWRTNGTDENTLEAAAVDHATRFFKLNGKLYMFTSYLGALYNALYKFDDDFTFTNTSGDNKWSNPNNWRTKMIPLNFDDATIPSSFSPIINSNAFVNSLEMNSPLTIESGNLNVNATLNLGAKLILNNGNLTLKGNASEITNGNESNYIVIKGNGEVKIDQLNSARGIVQLPIGTENHFNPITIANSGATDSFSVKVSEGISNTTNGAVNATWDISEGTVGESDVNLTLGWSSSQQNSNFNLHSAKIGHFVNGAWIEENSGTATGSGPYKISASGISSFSPFSVMNFEVLSSSDSDKNRKSIFPSPFNLMLSVEIQEEGEVRLYDLIGREVLNKRLTAGRNDIKVSHLPIGTYIYVIKSLRSQVEKKGKIIKR